MGQPECKFIYFPCVSPNEHDQCIKTNEDMTPYAKWLHHIDFDNPNSIFYDI